MTTATESKLATVPLREQPRHWRMRHDCAKYYTIAHGTPNPSLPKRVNSWVSQFALHCIAVYRLGQLGLVLRQRSRLIGTPVFLAYLLLNYFVRLIHKVQIPHEARIGPGLYLGHAHGIVLGPGTIGANCNLTHNVTVGVGLGATGRGIPTIADEVWIGTGSIISGPITVGKGATIAAGSVVSRDVPPRSLVAGNPARVAASDYDNSALLGFRVPGEGG